MKKFSCVKLYFYMTIMASLLLNVEKSYAQQMLLDNVVDHDLQMTFRILSDIRHQIENLPPEESHLNSDITVHIVIVFIEMYKKIVEATVTYYLMPSGSIKQSLHDVIIRIIAEDTVRLIAFLCKELVHFMFDQKMSWQEKLYHCAWVVSVILIIKTGVENLPATINPVGIIKDSTEKNEEKPFWPKAKTDIPY